MHRRTFLMFCLTGGVVEAAVRRRRPTVFFMKATAHSQEGLTAGGTISRRGTVAADPRVLPIGSRIRVTGAGPYSGVYSVEDTGRAIKGREIDIYMDGNAEAKRFGRKRVRVTVLKYGDGEVAGLKPRADSSPPSN